MPVKHVTVREAHQKQSEGYTYVDVRSIPEFAHGHPEGAVNVPLLHRDEATGQMVPNREFLPVMKANFPLDVKLLIGCEVGGRSVQAAELLAAAGYQDVSNVLGGFGGARDPRTGGLGAEGWIHAGLPVESSGPGEESYEHLRSRSAGKGGR